MLIKGLKNLRKDNRGATMVMAVIAIAFVAILATMILAASLANINMKRMENRSKDTFYTSESVLEEVRAGLGKEGLNQLSESYKKVITTLVSKDENGLSIVSTNEVANRKLKKIYIENMFRALTASPETLAETSVKTIIDPTALTNAKNYLNTFIKGYNETNQIARVQSIGKILANEDAESIEVEKYTIILKDVIIEYKEDRADENYFSNLTVDLVVDFPDISIDFTGSNRLQEFTEYSLVSDMVIQVNGSNLEVNGSHIYAGDSIRVTSDESIRGHMKVTGNVYKSTGTITNANIVTRGDIIVRGNSAIASSFEVEGGDIWCDNLVADSKPNSEGRDKTIGANITIDSRSKTYVRDDLNAYGNNSKFTIGGKYFGYKYDGADVSSNKQSSAIIVTGDNSVINMDVSDLIIGGRSYVIIPGNSDYMTGESLSVKADQDLYLIPSKYVYGGVSNPMSLNTYNLVTEQAEAAGEDFVKVDSSLPVLKGINGTGTLLDTTEPYVTKIDGSTVYLYYNFAKKEYASEYVRRILSGTDTTLKGQMNTYFKSVFSSSSSGVKINAGNLYTAGALIQTNGAGVSNITNTGNFAASDFILTSKNYTNRYDILKYLLLDIDESMIVTDKEDAIKSQYSSYEVDVNTFNRDASTAIVDYPLVDAKDGYNKSSYLVNMEGYKYIKTIQTGAGYTVPAYVNGGIIVSEGSVTLDHNFKGLIIARGNIIIKNSATITTDMNLIEYLIMNEDLFVDQNGSDVEPTDVGTPFRQFFYAYKEKVTSDESDPLFIETISYEDIVGYRNWRKYDDK